MRWAAVAGASADVVVQDVDTTITMHTRVGQRQTLALVRHIGNKYAATTTACFEHHQGLFGRLLVMINQQHLRPFFGKTNSRCPTVADGIAGRLTSANHDRNLVF